MNKFATLPQMYDELMADHVALIDENRRLLEKSIPMKYRRMEFNARLQRENDKLRKQLGAAIEFISQIESYGQDELYTKANAWLRENKL